MHKATKVVLLFAVLALVSLALVADDKPDLSGTWKLDSAKSDFGAFPGPDSQANVIDHKDPKIKIKTTSKGGPRGDADYESTYTTDGKESTNQQGPREIKTIAK